MKKQIMSAIKFSNGNIFYIDQTKLPLKTVWRRCKDIKDGFIAIKQLRVRGAPLIGVFAAYCISLVAEKAPTSSTEAFSTYIKQAITYLRTARPTAVNLFWALSRMEKVVDTHKGKFIPQIKLALVKEANEIHRQDIALCQHIATYGVKLISKNDSILTHCNTGFLATGGEGTALGIIYLAARKYKNIHVYIDETRPLLQGARLTAWELMQAKVSCTLISDTMAAYLMQQGKIHKVFVGADRITANGDTANKIGTYNVAVLANYHKIPFYVAAPVSTFDLTLKCGADIPIEERRAEEVCRVLNKVVIAPPDINVYNPSFDVTPHDLITAIISDRGIIYPPFTKNIKQILK